MNADLTALASRLRTLASKASPGPYLEVPWEGYTNGIALRTQEDPYLIAAMACPDNADYLAALDPATILRLLDAAQVAQAEALANYAAPLEAELKAAEDAQAQLSWDLEAMAAERNTLAAEIEGEREGRLALRTELGARNDETFLVFIRRLAKERERWRDAHISAEAAFEDMLASFRKAVEAALDGPGGETVEDGIVTLGLHALAVRRLREWRSEPDEGALAADGRRTTFVEGRWDAKAEAGRILDDALQGRIVASDATRSEDRIVERVLDGVAEMICTAMEKSGQGQAAGVIRGGTTT